MDAKDLRRVLDFARAQRCCHVDWAEGRRAEEQVVADAIAAEVARAVAEEREDIARQVRATFTGVVAVDAVVAAIRAWGTKEVSNG